MRQGFLVIEAAPGSAMAVIRFRPGGAFPFLGFPVEGITETVEELDHVLGQATASLRDRVLEAFTIPEKMRAVEAWLLERSRGKLEPNPIIEYVTERLASKGDARIADIVGKLGFSQRHVHNVFRRWVGLSPKQYGRVRRFQEVLRSIARPYQGLEDMQLRGAPLDEPDWIDVALAHGYYDQSHLIRDFRDFAGMSPGAYVAAFRGLENYLPIG